MIFKDIDKVFWPEAGRGESRVFLWALCKPVRVCWLGEDGGGRERERKRGKERRGERKDDSESSAVQREEGPLPPTSQQH